MAEVDSVRVNVEVDPRIHAVKAIRDLQDVIPAIVGSGVKVEIEFSTMKSVGVTSTRDSIAIIFSKDEV
jgi:hypothetical protein